MISCLAKRAYSTAVFATCHPLRLALVVLIGGVALISMRSLAQAQAGESPLQDIPGPNHLWFLEPFMPKSSSPSTSMEPVTIELTNRAGKVILLNIPRAYIAEISDPRQTDQTYVTLAVYLPDYLPRFLADRAGHKTRGEKINNIELRSSDEIAVYLRVTAPGTIAKSIMWTRSNRINGGTYKEKFDLYYDVSRPTPQAQPQPRKEFEYLIPHNRDDLVIRCAANVGASEMLGCRMKFEREDLELQVAFSSKYLDNYSEIKDRVLEIVGTFFK